LIGANLFTLWIGTFDRVGLKTVGDRD
jgi:hypothetical protein